MDAITLLTGDAQTFCEKVWARRVGSYRRDPATLSSLLDLDDADALLTGASLRTPELRIAKNGTVLDQSTFTRQGAAIAGQPLTGLVDVAAALREFDQGATIVFQGLHRYWPPLAELISSLETELGHPCQANAYLTPPGGQGFAVHSDSHDVFVFQTHGTKQWEIHVPTDDPAPETGSPEPSGRRVEQVRFEPGVVMYLPTGTPHAARAQDGVSLHVTVGINQLTWRGVVGDVLENLVAEIDPGHLPAGYLHEPGRLAEGYATRLRALADRIHGLDPGALAETHVARFLTTRNPVLRGALRDLAVVDTIGADTALRRRRGSRLELRPRGERLVLLLGDRRLEVPGRLRPAIEAVATGEPFTPAELDLDTESALVLARRLVREGLCEVVDA